jgi:alkaline phosphatase
VLDTANPGFQFPRKKLQQAQQVVTMRFQTAPLVVAAGAALIDGAQAKDCPKAKNFIYVVPDGFGIASQTMARDYYSITNGEGTVERPNSIAIGIDSMV